MSEQLPVYEVEELELEHINLDDYMPVEANSTEVENEL